VIAKHREQWRRGPTILSSSATSAGRRVASGRSRRNGRPVALTDLVDQPVGDLEKVVPLVPVVGHRHRYAQALRIARGERLAELDHLAAEVVDVELAGHLVAGEGQQPAERVAHRRIAGVADVQGSRRIDADELDIDLLPALGRQHTAAVVAAERQHGPGRAAIPAVAQEQIEKPRAGDLEALADGGPRPGAPAPAQLVGQLARVAARLSRHRQGDRRRDVAELGLGRQRQLDGRQRRLDGRGLARDDRNESSLERPSQAGQPVQLLVILSIAHLIVPLLQVAAAPPGAPS
jgi:hypothetical protein